MSRFAFSMQLYWRLLVFLRGKVQAAPCCTAYITFRAPQSGDGWGYYHTHWGWAGWLCYRKADAIEGRCRKMARYGLKLFSIRGDRMEVEPGLRGIRMQWDPHREGTAGNKADELALFGEGWTDKLVKKKTKALPCWFSSERTFLKSQLCARQWRRGSCWLGRMRTAQGRMRTAQGPTEQAMRGLWAGVPHCIWPVSGWAGWAELPGTSMGKGPRRADKSKVGLTFLNLMSRDLNTVEDLNHGRDWRRGLKMTHEL